MNAGRWVLLSFLLLATSSLVAGGAEEDSTEVLASARFEVRTLTRDAFRLPLPERRVASPASLDRTIVPAMTEHAPQASLLGWRQVATGLSGTASTPRGDHPGIPGSRELRLRLRAESLISAGVLRGEVELVEQRRRDHLTRALLDVDTWSGWRGTVGDAGPINVGPVAHGLTARGLSIERTGRPGNALRVTVGMMMGRAPVQYANTLWRKYPRDVGSIRLGARIREGWTALGQWVHFSDRAGREVVGASPIRAGSAAGVSLNGAHRSIHLDMALLESKVRWEDRLYETGTVLEYRVRGGNRRGSLSASGEASRGSGHTLGTMGVLSNSPRRTLALDGALRLRERSALGLWTGTWAYPPEPEPIGRASSADTLRSRRQRASEGWNWGAKLTFRAPRANTDIVAVREVRHRELRDAVQNVTTYSLAATQELSPQARASLRLNVWREPSQGTSHYLSGSVSRSIAGGTASFQQQTVWQEPQGVRLVTIAEVSGMKLLGRFPADARLTQTHERGGGAFVPAETRGTLQLRVPAARHFDLMSRYEAAWRPGQLQHSFEIGLNRNFGSGDQRVPGSAGPLVSTARQLMGGVVFEDENGDGVRQEHEPGVPGVAVVIDQDVREPAVTDLGGRFRAVVAPGRHLVRLLPESVPTTYSLDGLRTAEVVVTPDQLLEFDVPLTRRVGWISGRVALETTLASRMPAGERRCVERIKVTLDGLSFTYTDAEGRFAFRALPAGEHVVAVDGETVQPGLRIDGPASQRVVVAGDQPDGTPCAFVLNRPVRRTVF